MPARECAETKTASGSATRSWASTTGSAASILLTTSSSRGSDASRSPATSRSTWRTASICRCGITSLPSTTCSRRSASTTSSSVDRKASTSWVGRCRTKPTVSVRTTSRPSVSTPCRVVGSSVANRAFCTSTPASVSALSRLDLPALVYPAIATAGTPERRRAPRLVSRACFMPLISRRSFAIRSRIRRRSVSIFVSPGPRRPTPPLLPARPPACRDSASPQPRSRGSMYSICARLTCALPSREVACWAKMSRIRAVRSMTLTFTTFSSALSCAGVSSPSQITVSAPVASTTSRSSCALPEPMYVAGSGRSRRWITPSRTAEPAVSARALSSASEASACAAEPDVHTPTSTTCSRRNWRYSTSVTSSSSVERPTTRRSDERSSNWSSPTVGAGSQVSMSVICLQCGTPGRGRSRGFSRS